MRSPAIDDKQLLERLCKVFKEFGYEGASLNELSESVGLKKASLYHRFPNGKEQMAEAILDYAFETLVNEVFSPLDKSLSARDKAKHITRNLCNFYENGKVSCLLDTMSLTGKQGEVVIKKIKDATNYIIQNFGEVAEQSGMPKVVAKQRGEMAFALLQGALVLGRTRKEVGSFKRIMKNFEIALTVE